MVTPLARAEAGKSLEAAEPVHDEEGGSLPLASDAVGGAVAMDVSPPGLEAEESDDDEDEDEGPPLPCIVFFDSLKAHNAYAVCANLREYLNCELAARNERAVAAVAVSTEATVAAEATVATEAVATEATAKGGEEPANSAAGCGGETGGSGKSGAKEDMEEENQVRLLEPGPSSPAEGDRCDDGLRDSESDGDDTSAHRCRRLRRSLPESPDCTSVTTTTAAAATTLPLSPWQSAPIPEVFTEATLPRIEPPAPSKDNRCARVCKQTLPSQPPLSLTCVKKRPCPFMWCVLAYAAFFYASSCAHSFDCGVFVLALPTPSLTPARTSREATASSPRQLRRRPARGRPRRSTSPRRRRQRRRRGGRRR